MANDPMTVDSVVSQDNIRDGLKIVTLLVSGPADYDASAHHADFDISDYVSTVYNVVFGAATAAGDNGIVPRYISADFTDATAGGVNFVWSADGTDGEALIEVTDTTNLSGYQWRVTIIGKQ